MLKHYGFTCWISSEGRPLPVYVEEAQDNVKSAWIASETEKQFSVAWKDNSGKRIATSGHIFVDGKDVASAIIRPGRSTPVERSGVKKNARIIKPFKFSELSLTDDETLANIYDNTLKDVGTIRVEISRVQLGEHMRFEGYEAEDLGYVHEKAKKAGAHCTSFGEEKRKEVRTVAVSTAPYDPNEPGPYVTFVFRYRSREMLKANGIIGGKNDNRRKRPSEDEEVIEIESDEEAGLSSGTPQREVNQNTSSPTKRIKTEGGVNDEPSRTEDAEEQDAHSDVGATGLNEGPNIDQETQISQSSQNSIKKIKPDTEEGKELDMLFNDKDDSNETEAFDNPLNDNVDSLIPPISSSPGPELEGVKDEDELDE